MVNLRQNRNIHSPMRSAAPLTGSDFILAGPTGTESFGQCRKGIYSNGHLYIEVPGNERGVQQDIRVYNTLGQLFSTGKLNDERHCQYRRHLRSHRGLSYSGWSLQSAIRNQSLKQILKLLHEQISQGYVDYLIFCLGYCGIC